jgi:type IV pilus assembly protein PilC
VTSFAYSAINAEGREFKGEIQATDLPAAREALRLKGLLAQKLEPAKAAATGRRGKKVKPKSLQVFARQFATMIEAGLSIVSALVVLEEQTADKALATVIAEVREDVEAGLLLSQAMAKHPAVFTRLFVAMVEAGEAAGILDEVLDRMAVQIEKETKIKRRVKGAMLYPTVVMSFATLVLIGMLMFLVPVFVSVFDQFNGELPMLTAVVLKASNAMKGSLIPGVPVPGIVFMLAAAGGGGYALKRWMRTEDGRRVWDSLKLRLPMKIGDIVLKVGVARFSRTLATLVAAGVDIIKSLEITATTSGNYVIEKALNDVRAKVHEGVPIAQPLTESGVFPPMVSHMVKVGEETGELEKMLGKVADFYEDEVDSSIASLTSIIEPLMMIGVGLMVGIIVISMYLPMFKMLSLIADSG